MRKGIYSHIIGPTYDIDFAHSAKGYVYVISTQKIFNKLGNMRIFAMHSSSKLFPFTLFNVHSTTERQSFVVATRFNPYLLIIFVFHLNSGNGRNCRRTASPTNKYP